MSNTVESSCEHHGLRILVAEDIKINQLVVIAILNRLGYEADVASNGLEVLESLKTKTYDVILMDICMPEMDGLETSSIIRQQSQEFGEPWIIAVTAHPVLGDHQKCVQAGMNDYISKPISLKTVTAALDRYKSCAAQLP